MVGHPKGTTGCPGGGGQPSAMSWPSVLTGRAKALSAGSLVLSLQMALPCPCHIPVPRHPIQASASDYL